MRLDFWRLAYRAAAVAWACGTVATAASVSHTSNTSSSKPAILAPSDETQQPLDRSMCAIPTPIYSQPEVGNTNPESSDLGVLDESFDLSSRGFPSLPVKVRSQVRVRLVNLGLGSTATHVLHRAACSLGLVSCHWDNCCGATRAQHDAQLRLVRWYQTLKKCVKTTASGDTSATVTSAALNATIFGEMAAVAHRRRNLGIESSDPGSSSNAASRSSSRRATNTTANNLEHYTASPLMLDCHRTVLAKELEIALVNVATSGIEVLGDTPYSYLAPELVRLFSDNNAPSVTKSAADKKSRRQRSPASRLAVAGAAAAETSSQISVQFVNTRRDPQGWAHSRQLHHGADLVCGMCTLNKPASTVATAAETAGSVPINMVASNTAPLCTAWSLLSCGSNLHCTSAPNTPSTALTTPASLPAQDQANFNVVGPEFVLEKNVNTSVLEAHFVHHQHFLVQLLGSRLLQICLWDVPTADGSAHLQSLLRTLVSPAVSSG